MAGKIFVSYRRDDDPAAAARVKDGLARRFGEASLFLDVDNLLAGRKFDDELAKALAASDVFIAIIGTRWMDVLKERTATGERDHVREEIAEALRREILVIPVRVGREGNLCEVPRPDALPQDIRELSLYQKHDVTHENYPRDIAALGDAIAQSRREDEAKVRSRVPWVGIGAFLACFLAVSYVAAHFAGGWVLWPWSAAAPVTPLASVGTDLSPKQTQPCTFAGTWQDDYGTNVIITQAGSGVTGSFILGNGGGTLPFKGSVTGKDSVTEQKLRAIFPPTPTPNPAYQKGGAIEFTLANGNCIRINGWMSNSMGQFQGEPGGVLHTNISLRRSVIVPP